MFCSVGVSPGGGGFFSKTPPGGGPPHPPRPGGGGFGKRGERAGLMRAALLARVSDVSQAATDRMSLPAQLRQMRERCEREGWAVVREFVESGVSAYTREMARRPGLLAAVESAERGEYDVLLVHDSSRFARKVGLHFDVLERLERVGVALLEADQPWAPSNADSFMVDVVKAGVNEYWSRKISEHIKKAKRERWDRGLRS